MVERKSYMDLETPGRAGFSTFEAILLAAILILFVGNFALHDARGFAGHGDTFHYVVPAANWLAGHGYTYLGAPELIFPPGYGLSALPFYLAGFELVEAAMIANVIFFALTCLFAYLICRIYVSRLFALLPVLFLVTNAFVMSFTAVGSPSPLYMATMVGAGYFILRFIHRPERNPLNLVVAGLLAGWSALTRPEGLGIAVALLGFLLLDLFIRQPSPRISARFAARLLLYAVVYAVPIAAVYAPYSAFISSKVGEFTLTTKANSNIAEAQGNFQAGTENEVLKRDLYLESLQSGEGDLVLGYDLRQANVKTTLWQDLRRFAINLVSYAKYLIGENIAALAAVAVLFAAFLWRAGFRSFPMRFDKLSDLWESLGFCLFMLSPILPMAYFIAKPRLFAPYNVFVLIGAIILLERIFAYRAGAVQRADWRYLAAAVAVPVILFDGYFNATIARDKSEFYPLQLASAALADLADRQPVNVATLRRPSMALYYANGRQAPFEAKAACVAPQTTPEAIMRDMREMGLHYLLLDRVYLPTRPSVKTLWTCAPGSCPAGLDLIADEPNLYRIFALSETGPAPAASAADQKTALVAGKDCR